MIVRVAPGTILFHLRSYLTVLQSQGEKACMTANGPFCQHRFKTSGGGLYPEFNGEIVGAEIACGVAEADLAVEAIEIKRLSHNAGDKGKPARECARIVAYAVISIAATRPPSDQTGWRSNALRNRNHRNIIQQHIHSYRRGRSVFESERRVGCRRGKIEPLDLTITGRI